MRQIKKNRFTLFSQRQEAEDEVSSFSDSSSSDRKRPQKPLTIPKQIIAGAIILAVTLGVFFVFFHYYKQPQIVIPEIGGKENSSIYTRTDKNEIPETEYTNIHLKRGKESFDKGYYNDAVNEFNQVVESDAPDKEKAAALLYLGIIEDERGNFAKAEDLYKRALRYDSTNPSIYRNLAITYKHQKKYPEALDAITKAVDLAPNSANNLIFRGNLYYDMMKYTEALDSYKAALALEPENPSALYNTAQAYLKKGDEPLAIEYFKKAATFDKTGKIAYLAYSKLGLIELDNGAYEAAEKYLKTAVSMNPSDAVDHYNLGVVYIRMMKNDLALAEFVKAQELGAQDAEMLENLGTVYSALKEYDRGIDVYKKLLTINGRNTKIMARLGEIYFQKGNIDDALQLFRKITELEPASDNARVAFLNMGNIFDEAQRFDDAIEAYNHAIAISPKDDAAYYNLGIAYKHSGKNEKALEAWKQAILLNPDNPKPHMAMADMLYDLGYLDDALAEYLKISEKWPLVADAQFAVATIYNKKGVTDFAEKRYLKVVEINSSKDLTTKAYINLGIIASNRVNRENPDEPGAKALEYIQKALAYKPADPEALTALGIVYYKRGAYEQAIETFYLVVKGAPDEKISAEAYNNIGKAYYQKKDFKNALRNFNLGVEADPTNEELRMNRKSASQAYEANITR